MKTNETNNVTKYRYDHSGNRTVKAGKYGEVLYVNNNFTVRNGDLESKHVFAGNSRLCSKMILTEEVDGTEQKVEKGIYYYHADHLGSSSSVTNKSGGFHEHIEYFPYGETWVSEKISDDVDGVHYKFTGKELDPETGLYYFGARYYDPVVSRWINTDPALQSSKYFPKPQDFDPGHDYFWYIKNNKNDKLPGLGGVYYPVNFNVYHYAGLNPVKLSDSEGEFVFAIPLVVIGASALKAAALTAVAYVGYKVVDHEVKERKYWARQRAEVERDRKKANVYQAKGGKTREGDDTKGLSVDELNEILNNPDSTTDDKKKAKTALKYRDKANSQKRQNKYRKPPKKKKPKKTKNENENK